MTLKIVVDSREKQCNVSKYLQEHGVDVHYEQLKVADYIVSEKIGIERKSGTDFSASLCDGRLFEQAKHIVNSYEIPMMIIENPNTMYRRNITPQALQGAMLSLSLKYNIKILFTRHEKDTALMLKTLCNKEQNINKNRIVIHNNKPNKSINDIQLFIIAALPGIGHTNATNLLSHFKSVKNVMNATQQEIQNVNGIRKNVAENIYTIINKRNEQ